MSFSFWSEPFLCFILTAGHLEQRQHTHFVHQINTTKKDLQDVELYMDAQNPTTPQAEIHTLGTLYRNLPEISASVSSGCLGRWYCGAPPWRCGSAPTPPPSAPAGAEETSASPLCAAFPGSLRSVSAWLPSWSHPAPLGGGGEWGGHEWRPGLTHGQAQLSQSPPRVLAACLATSQPSACPKGLAGSKLIG